VGGEVATSRLRRPRDDRFPACRSESRSNRDEESPGVVGRSAGDPSPRLRRVSEWLDGVRRASGWHGGVSAYV